MKKLAWLAPVVLLVAAATARADVLPPEVEACKSSKVGDKCSGGTCQKGKCSRLDYSKDATPPPAMEYDCIKCVSGSASDGGADKKSDSGCNVAHLTERGRPLAPWLLGGAFAALVLRGRRRRT